MRSTFPSLSRGTRNPLTFQKRDVDVSRCHSIVLHKVTGRRGNISPLSRFICGQRCLRCSESHVRAAFAFCYFTKRDLCLVGQTRLAVDLGSAIILPLLELEVDRQTARRRNQQGITNMKSLLAGGERRPGSSCRGPTGGTLQQQLSCLKSVRVGFQPAA